MKSSSQVMRNLAQKFDNMCQVTHKKFEDRGFAIHHIWEIRDDILRKNYQKGAKGRQEYLNDLEPLVQKELTWEEKEEFRSRVEFIRIRLNEELDRVLQEPKRFALIKNFVHTRLDHLRYGTTRFPMEQRFRFVVLALLTVHSKGRKK